MDAPQPPTLTGPHIRLRPLTAEDYPVLHRWETDVETLYLWQPQTAVLGYEEFVERRRNGNQGVHVQMLVVAREGGRPLGTVFSFDVSLVHGYGSLGVYLEPSSVGRGLGVEAGYLFVGYLMAYYPLRKLYTDIYAYNERSLRLAGRLGFVVEGTLRAHRWFADRYWDLYKLALYREAWERFKATYQP